MASTLPPNAEKANANTLADALAATSISSSPSPPSEPKELSNKAEDDLEDGEIREEDEDAEEDDGKVKTVFDSAKRFNVKVRSRDPLIQGRRPQQHDVPGHHHFIVLPDV